MFNFHLNVIDLNDDTSAVDLLNEDGELMCYMVLPNELVNDQEKLQAI